MIQAATMGMSAGVSACVCIRLNFTEYPYSRCFPCGLALSQAPSCEVGWQCQFFSNNISWCLQSNDCKMALSRVFFSTPVDHKDKQQCCSIARKNKCCFPLKILIPGDFSQALAMLGQALAMLGSIQDHWLGHILIYAVLSKVTT